MKTYDPELAPAADEWLALDEGERIMLVEHYHRDARVPLPRNRRQLHASMHVMVENQLALNDDTVIRTLSRLREEGLSRHDGIHAVASCFLGIAADASNRRDASELITSRYYEALEELTARAWLNLGED